MGVFIMVSSGIIAACIDMFTDVNLPPPVWWIWGTFTGLTAMWV